MSCFKTFFNQSPLISTTMWASSSNSVRPHSYTTTRIAAITTTSISRSSSWRWCCSPITSRIPKRSHKTRPWSSHSSIPICRVGRKRRRWRKIAINVIYRRPHISAFSYNSTIVITVMPVHACTPIACVWRWLLLMVLRPLLRWSPYVIAENITIGHTIVTSDRFCA